MAHPQAWIGHSDWHGASLFSGNAFFNAGHVIQILERFHYILCPLVSLLFFISGKNSLSQESLVTSWMHVVYQLVCICNTSSHFFITKIIDFIHAICILYMYIYTIIYFNHLSISLYKQTNKDLSRNILNVEENLFNNSRQSDY